MKVYLAGPSIYQSILRETRDALIREGHIVTSRWLDVKDMGGMSHLAAQIDIDDIDAADVFVVFTLRPQHKNPTGGHHWETGYAYAKGKPIIVVGELTSIFQTLPSIRRAMSLGEVTRMLETLQ